MKRVQLAGGTFDVEGYLVGLERELRIDISNDSLRLHDGVKARRLRVSQSRLQ